MSAQPPPTVDIRSRRAWRVWLERNHASVAEVWLVFYKQHTGTPGVEYEAAVEEALCFGWVDSLVRRLDEDRFARKFTPRRSDSVWSESNRRRYAETPHETVDPAEAQRLLHRSLVLDAGRARVLLVEHEPDLGDRGVIAFEPHAPRSAAADIDGRRGLRGHTVR